METLGCYLSASHIERKGEKYMVGPLFTADKLNENGWRLTQQDAKSQAEALVGKDVSMCNCANDIKSLGVSKEHACDVTGQGAVSVATVTDVYKKTVEGSDVWYAEAKLKENTGSDILPTGWSVFGDADGIDARGYASHPRLSSIALTNRPAWDEARTTIIAASKNDVPASNINRATDNNNVQSSMTGEPGDKGGVAPVQVAAPVPADVVSKKELEDAVKSIKVPEVNEAQIVERVRAELVREETAKAIVAKMVRIGSITEAEKDAKFTELKSLDKSALETLRNTVDKITPPKPAPEPGIAETPIGGQGSSGQFRPLADGEKVWAARLGLSEDVWRKYNK